VVVMVVADLGTSNAKRGGGEHRSAALFFRRTVWGIYNTRPWLFGTRPGLLQNNAEHSTRHQNKTYTMA
jgi:hypothetical protein